MCPLDRTGVLGRVGRALRLQSTKARGEWELGAWAPAAHSLHTARSCLCPRGLFIASALGRRSLKWVTPESQQRFAFVYWLQCSF